MSTCNDKLDKISLKLKCIGGPKWAADEITRLRDEVEKYKLAVDSFVELIGASYGVAGLHLNGDIAEWSELLSGGRYEEWLSPIEAVLSEGK